MRYVILREPKTQRILAWELKSDYVPGSFMETPEQEVVEIETNSDSIETLSTTQLPERARNKANDLSMLKGSKNPEMQALLRLLEIG